MKKIITAILMLLSVSVFAGYDGWSEGTLSSVRVQGNYERIMLRQEGQSNPGSCSDSTYLYLKMEDSTRYDSMYSAILTGYAAKKTVKLALTGCSNGGTSGYPVITEVWVLN